MRTIYRYNNPIKNHPMQRPLSAGNRRAPGRSYAPSTKPAFLAGFAVCVSSLVFGNYWLSSVGLGASAYYFTRLLTEAGEDLPIESLILTIASLQWIVAPMFDYWGFSHHYKFHMYVPEEDYMTLAVPSVLLYSVGLYILRPGKRIAFIRNYSAITKEIVARSRKLPIYLIGIGFVFSYMAGRLPESLAFPVYIFSSIKYIGLIYLLFSDWLKNKKVPLLVAFLAAFMSSLHTAMFHDLLLWSAFVGMYAAYVLKPSAKQKIALVLLAVSFVAVLQIAKDQYRMLLIQQGSNDYLSKFVTAVDNEMMEDPMSSNDNVQNLVVRFNQGWIISRIMQMVPAAIPYADGDTIITAIKTSILPRILYPDKPIAGGKENFEKYTGFMLGEETSMGISQLGEAYINFGVEGAWVFMLFFGLSTSFVIQWLFRLTRKYPTIWLWLPLILLHFVKAETELLVQLNYLTKSIVLVLLFIWGSRTFLKWKL